MRRRCAGAIALTVGLFAACADVPQAPVEMSLRLARTDAWSGGELVIITPPVGHGVPAFSVRLDGTPLESHRADDTTLIASLPDLPGEHRVTLVAAGATAAFDLGLVRLHGFRDAVDAPPLKGTLRVWPAGGRPTVLGVSARGPALLDLSSRTLREWPDSIHGPGCTMGGIGASWRPDYFVFQGRRPGAQWWDCMPFQVWRLLPEAATAPGTLPTPQHPTPAWASAEVAPDRWLFTTDDHTWGFDCRSGTCVENLDLYWTGGGTMLFLSPRGDRVLASDRARMFDPTTLSILFTLDGYAYIWDAAFTPAGDSVFVVGADGLGPQATDRMRVLRPDDGALLADLPLAGPDGTPISPIAIALDPVAPRIYVAGTVPVDTLNVPAMLVVDRDSRAPVALLRAPVSEGFGRVAPFDGLTIVAAPLDRTTYVVWETLIYEPPSFPTRVYRFDRLP